ncbi:MAG: hypothetical protein Q7S39_01525 [Ignavibacteria bacterium]|nr:hypothetical protein [Ignavibacteria bacterium]
MLVGEIKDRIEFEKSRCKINFKNKVCVVTGGANGIGFCIVNEFSKLEAKVAFKWALINGNVFDWVNWNWK